jgi:hypothetical protein
MPKYLLSYHGGLFPPELADETGRNWTRWADALGAAFVDRGGPLMRSKTVGKGGVVTETGAHETTGYGILEAESLDAAIAIAKNCPQLLPPHKNGTIEVAELIVM